MFTMNQTKSGTLVLVQLSMINFHEFKIPNSLLYIFSMYLK